MFHSFLSDGIKLDAKTTAAHSKHIMALLNNRKLLTWENKYGCSDQYICATELYLLSMFSHEYNIVIYCGVGSPGHGKDVVDGLDATENNSYNVDDNCATSC